MSAVRSSRPSSRVSLPAVMASEVVKLASLRSAWWLGVSALLAPLAVTAVWAVNQFGPAPTVSDVFAATAAPQGETVLLLVLLGTVCATAEYDNKAITTTFSAVPQRTPVLLAKAIVVFVTTAVVGILGALGSFLVADAMGGGVVGITEPSVLLAIAGMALYYACAAVIAMSIGMLIRSTIGGLAVSIVFLFVLPGFLQIFGWEPLSLVAETLPSSAVDSFTSTATAYFPPVVAAIAMLAWTLIWLISTVWATKRRDA